MWQIEPYTQPVQIKIYDTAADVANEAATYLANMLGERRNATLGLAGGNTPRATYELLAHTPIEWNRVTMWLGDERWVPPSHSNCNARMITEALCGAIDGLLVTPEFGNDPRIAAAKYADLLADIWVDQNGSRLPDIVLLGVGDDGHTASLFPGTNALEETQATYVANWIEPKGLWRLTATLPLLWSARQIIFLVTGKEKADIMARILDDEEPLPAQRTAAGAVGKVLWLLDQAAAKKLRPRSRISHRRL